jgi:hypothetical protein
VIEEPAPVALEQAHRLINGSDRQEPNCSALLHHVRGGRENFLERHPILYNAVREKSKGYFMRKAAFLGVLAALMGGFSAVFWNGYEGSGCVLDKQGHILTIVREGRQVQIPLRLTESGE